MTQRNVETVRQFFEKIERAFDAYWNEPRSIAAAVRTQNLWPAWSEVFSCVDPQIEWQTVFLGETFRGHLETAAAWDDFLGWAEDYHPALKEIADLGGDRVYAAVALVGTGKNSGMRMDATFFDVITVRDGLIVRIEEYTERDQALEAVGLEE
jgi:ketosteroid isomerase-like protein